MRYGHRLIGVLGVGACFILGSSPGYADSISFIRTMELSTAVTDEFPTRDRSWSFQFEQFDPALGDLESVAYQHMYSASSMHFSEYHSTQSPMYLLDNHVYMQYGPGVPAETAGLRASIGSTEMYFDIGYLGAYSAGYYPEDDVYDYVLEFSDSLYSESGVRILADSAAPLDGYIGTDYFQINYDHYLNFWSYKSFWLPLDVIGRLPNRGWADVDETLTATITYNYTPRAAPVPEPSSLFLVSAGLMGLAELKRRVAA